MAETRDPAFPAVLAALARHVQAVAARDRSVVDIGPFRAFFSDTSDDPLMSLALPCQAPADWHPGIVALKAAFAARQRTLRLEYFGELFPTLAGALRAQGFDDPDRMPVQSLAAEDLVTARASPEIVLSCPEPDDREGLRGLMALQARCFESLAEIGDEGWLGQMQRDIARGLATVCVAAVDGATIGGAMLVSGGGAAELVGVATDPAWRRRRVASITCARLLADYFAAGGRLAWLSAGSPSAHALYKRLGFRQIGSQLNAALPRPAA